MDSNIVDKEREIKETLKNLSPERLLCSELCYFCVASGMPIEDAINDSKKMKEGPVTLDRKCNHCYDTEEEEGRLRLTDRERRDGKKYLDLFEEYKREILESL